MLSPMSGTQPAAVIPSCLERSLNAQRVLFEDLSSAARSAFLNYVFDDQTPVDWTEEDVVFLHWKMLHRLVDLCEPATPLEEKIDMLRWVFTDRILDDQPFSFASCVRVAALSPHSPIPYCGVTDPDEVRDWLRHHVRAWLGATIDRYPAWVQAAIVENPTWVEKRLARNPQWINEQVKQHALQGDLFT